MKVRTGKIRQLSTGEFEFWPESGAIQALEPTDAPLETPLEVMIEGNRVVHWCRDTSKPAAYRDAHKKDLAQVAITDQPDSVDRVQADLDWSSPRLEGWMRWMSQGRKEPVRSTPYLLVVEDKGPFGLAGDWEPIHEHIESVNPGHEHNYHMIHGKGAGPGNAGLAYMNAGESLVFDITNLTTAMHEGPFGHNGGAGHDLAGTVMGARRHQLFAASTMEFTGVIQPEHVIHVDQDALLHLVAPEAPPLALEPGHQQIAYFDDDRYAIAVFGNELMIHSHTSGIARRTPWSTVKEVATLRNPGDTWRDVRFVRWWRGAAEVEIGNPPAAGPPEAVLPDESPIEGMDGVWFNPDHTHQGFQVFIRNGKATVYCWTWGSYRRGNFSDPLWILMQGDIINGVAHLTMQVPRPNRRERKMLGGDEAGGAVLYFESADTGFIKFWSRFDDRWWPGRGATRLSRLTVPVKRNAYDFKDREREGITVEVLPDGRKLIYHFGYEGTAEPGPNWQMAVSTKDNPDEFTIYQPDWGLPLTATRPTPPKPGDEDNWQDGLRIWGTATLTTTDDDENAGEYRFRERGWDKDVVRELVRLI